MRQFSLMAKLDTLLMILVLLSPIRGMQTISNVMGDANGPLPHPESGADVSSQINGIVEQVSLWAREHAAQTKDLPFVTLTYAQSLDGKIAMYLADSRVATSSNLPLSGPESLLMTHALRSIHDAILIGGRTLTIDNPRLSNRLWSGAEEDRQPRPVILDSSLKNIRKLGWICGAKAPIVCCSEDAASTVSSDEIPPHITILPCRVSSTDGMLDLRDVLAKLREIFGLQSVMVEGGATVLSSFANYHLADCICATVSPKLLGVRGLPAFQNMKSSRRSLSAGLLDLRSAQFYLLGNDCVLVSRWHDA
jgi:riboflavin-specific deaminase-like protein